MNIQDTYTQITEIGSGGGGTVYKAYHTRMQKYVVLKKIHAHVQKNTDIRAELDILKNLHHTYIPAVFDFIEDDGAIYLETGYYSMFTADGFGFNSISGKEDSSPVYIMK